MMKMQQCRLSVVALAGILFATGCDGLDSSELNNVNESNASAGDVERKVRDVVETTKDFAENKFDEYSKAIETKIQVLEQKHAELRRQAKQAGAAANADIQAEMQATLDSIKERKERLRRRLQELDSATGKALADLKAGIDQALKELESSYETALTRFSRSSES